MHKQTIVEDHKKLNRKPKSQYACHFTAATVSRQPIVNGNFDNFASNRISFGDVAAV